MSDLATELMTIVPHLREQHQYYSASVCYRAAEFLREYCDGHDNRPLQTNADSIRAMTDEDLSEYIDKHFAEAPWCNSPPADCPPHETCRLCIIDWLRSPVEV